MWIKHNVVFPYFSRAYRILEWKLPRKIRWDGLAAWPATLPDVTLLDFSLRGNIKTNMYHTGKPETSQQLLESINKATAAIRKKWECIKTSDVQ